MTNETIVKSLTQDLGLGVMPENMSFWQRHVTTPLMSWASKRLVDHLQLPIVNQVRSCCFVTI